MHSPLTKRSMDTNRDELDTKLELLSQLCLQDIDDSSTPDSPHSHGKVSYMDEQWIQAEYRWISDVSRDSAANLSALLNDEEDIDACTAHLYDPTLFSDPRNTPSKRRSLVLHRQGKYSEKDKPLPDIPRPSLVRTGVPDAPPPSPCTPRSPFPAFAPKTPPRSPIQAAFSPSPPRTPTAPSTPVPTPPSSPRVSSSPPRTPKVHTLPRTPQAPGPNVSSSESKNQSGRPSAVQRHATFPSISSTLELLEERESPLEKRAGVYVMDPQPQVGSDVGETSSGRARSASIGRTSGEAIKPALTGGTRSPKRKQRPTLPTLSTSTSSPQLRTFATPVTAAAAATSSSSPLSTKMVSTVGSPTVETPATSSANETYGFSTIPFSSGRDCTDEETSQLPSRWSLDSVASRPTQPMRPSQQSPTSPSGPAATQGSTGRTRDRLISFITRGRSGSLGKAPTLPPNPPASSQDVLDIGRRSVSKEPQFVMVSPRPSFSNPFPPMPFVTAASSSSSSSSSAASSASTLPTPAEPTDRNISPTKLSERSRSASDSFLNGDTLPRISSEARSSSATPLMPPFQYQDASYEAYERPPSPTSPPPAPTLPLPSPGTPSPSFLIPPRPQSFFSLALKRRTRRRGKKLVITGVPQGSLEGTGDRDLERRARDQKRRYENVVRWCESFGEIRKLERKEDGSLHVYWRAWEVADMVCRVQAQVYIKDVGRVNLAWHYIS